MKKSKIGIFFGLFVVLAGLGLFFGPARAKAASAGGNWSWTPPEAVKSFRHSDGKGVRVYIYSVQANELGEFETAQVAPPIGYDFEGSSWKSGALKTIGSGFFDDSLADLVAYYLSQYGSGKFISTSDRSYLYFDVDEQRFYFEYRGDDYLRFCIERFGSAYSEGYSDGHSDGHDEGYSEGWEDGYFTGSSNASAKYYAGYEDGYNEGHDIGYNEGYEAGRSGAYDEGYDSGYADGYEIGRAEGHQTGYDLGWALGYDEGESAGYARGYEEGESAGHESGYNQALNEFGGLLEDAYERGHGEGYDEGYDAGYNEASEEGDALRKVVPSAIGSIWLVVSDFLSIEVLGIAIWEIIGALVAIGLAILIVRMFL